MTVPEPCNRVVDLDQTIDNVDKALQKRAINAQQALKNVGHEVPDTAPDGLDTAGCVLVGGDKAAQSTHQHTDQGDHQQDGICIHGDVQPGLCAGSRSGCWHELPDKPCRQTCKVFEHAGQRAGQLAKRIHGKGLDLGALLLCAGIPEVGGRPCGDAFQIAVLDRLEQRLNAAHNIALDRFVDLLPAGV